jgi:hypothetical protein
VIRISTFSLLLLVTIVSRTSERLKRVYARLRRAITRAKIRDPGPRDDIGF